LGYNHNVRYRGLVFHVQTEDSGLLSPHLFTHMFHGGVIISTRKLVYDAGAAEDAIKSLMQAQHKAVLKDLKKGSFDDKIDQYLGGTPGLLPRGVDDGDRASEPSMARASQPDMPLDTPMSGMPSLDTEPVPRMERPETPPPELQRMDHSRPARSPSDVEAFELAPPGSSAAAKARTKTADRGSAPSAVRSGLVRSNQPPPPPDPEELNVPTLNDAAEIAAAVAAANAAPSRVPTNNEAATIPMELPPELSPLEIELELDEPEELPRKRPNANSSVEMPSHSDGVPKRAPGESVPPLPPPPHSQPRAQSAGVGAASLPPKPPVPPSRLPSRPAITPPQVVSRPIANDPRHRGEDAVEVYAPPPPSVEAPPGMPQERPGQYAQHKRVSQKMPAIDVVKERSGGVPVPSGLGRPGTARQGSISSSPSSGVPKPVGGDPRQTGGNPVVQRPGSGQLPTARAANQSGGHPAVGTQPVPIATRDQSSGARQRTPTPSRLATPTPARTQSSTTGSGSGGVVMTRPAVIVGAPAKPAQPGRVRKAREDEGRGFGQGLISEKSLDEVILAYLSEDADEK
jgi:hypothetical protein